MKKYNLFKIISITIGIVALLTWLIPATEYIEGSITLGEREAVGIWHLLTYIARVIPYMGAPVMFVLIVGGFYGLLNKTGVYKRLISKIAAKFKGSEKMFLTIVALLLATVTSVSGLSLGLFVIFPLLISIMLIMGYDRLTILTTLVGSVLVGIIGSIYADNIVGSTNTSLGLEFQTEALSRIFLLIISIFLLLVFIFSNKKSRLSRNYVDPLYLENKETKGKIWPMATVLGLSFLMIVLGSIAWQTAFSVNWFNDIHQKVLAFKLWDIPIIGRILGSMPAFGLWSFNEFSIVLLLASILIILIYKMKLDDAIAAFTKGARKVLAIAFLIGFAYIVFVITSNHLFYFTIINWLLNLTKTFNIVTMMLLTAIGSVLTIEMNFFAGALPLFTAIVTDAGIYPIMSLLIQAVYGLTMFVAPTSIILIVGLYYLDIPYLTWLKHIWKYVLQILIVITVMLTLIILV